MIRFRLLRGTRFYRQPVFIGFLIMAMTLLVSFKMANAHNHEEYYKDIRGHWARNWIDVLWSEGVTDGYRVQTYSPVHGWYRESRFLPDRRIRLDAWTVMVAKVFDLPPVASSPAYWLESGQEVSRLLVAAQKAGWVPASPNWSQNVSRQEAIKFLVQALDLGPYSTSLSTNRITQILSRYSDRSRIGSEYRAFVAAATHLGIVEGYPDRTFRPQNLLTRAEAATMLARSALARVEAKPNPFYPDGDGIDDETEFHLTSLRNRNISRWELIVEDQYQRRVWETGTRQGRAPSHPPTVRWDGRDKNNNLLPPGEYYYHFTVWDRNGQQFSSVRKPLIIDRRLLQGNLEPVSLYPGDTLTVRAQTWGDIRKVTAAVPDLGLSAQLQRENSSNEPRDWRTSFLIPDGTPPGLYTVDLKAEFSGATRDHQLSFLVLDQTWLEAWLEPSVLPAGGLITIHARSSANVTSVTAWFHDGTMRELKRIADNDWVNSWVVPIDTSEGSYPVLVVAESPYGPRQVNLEFFVVGDVRDQLETVLTD